MIEISVSAQPVSPSLSSLHTEYRAVVFQPLLLSLPVRRKYYNGNNSELKGRTGYVIFQKRPTVCVCSGIIN